MASTPTTDEILEAWLDSKAPGRVSYHTTHEEFEATYAFRQWLAEVKANAIDRVADQCEDKALQDDSARAGGLIELLRTEAKRHREQSR